MGSVGSVPLSETDPSGLHTCCERKLLSAISPSGKQWVACRFRPSQTPGHPPIDVGAINAGGAPGGKSGIGQCRQAQQFLPSRPSLLGRRVTVAEAVAGACTRQQITPPRWRQAAQVLPTHQMPRLGTTIVSSPPVLLLTILSRSCAGGKQPSWGCITSAGRLALRHGQTTYLACIVLAGWLSQTSVMRALGHRSSCITATASLECAPPLGESGCCAAARTSGRLRRRGRAPRPPPGTPCWRRAGYSSQLAVGQEGWRAAQ